MTDQGSAPAVVLVGIDGISFDLLARYITEGELPALESLANRGSFIPLASTQPPISPAAWTTITTGVNPGQHGVFDFVQHDPRTLKGKLVSSETVRVRRFYDYTAEHGLTACVANVPVTYPAGPLNGCLVTGLLTPADAPAFTYPAELGAKIVEEVGALDFGGEHAFRPERRNDCLEALLGSVNQRGQLALYLLRHCKTDLFFYVFMESDHAAHKLWGPFGGEDPPEGLPDGPYTDGILKVLRAIDHWVGRIREEVGQSATVFVLSDHGCGPLKGVLNVNRWLLEQGYLEPERQLARSPFRALARLDLVTKACKVLSALGLGRLAGRLPLAFRKKALASFQSLATDIAWRRTKAYATGYHGGIYINLEGREPFGIVRPDQYEGLCQEIATKLRELADASGQPLISRIAFGRSVYSGPFACELPDIVFGYQDGSIIMSQKLDLQNVSLGGPRPRVITGTHRSTGFLMANGPHTAVTHVPAREATAVDVAPTVRYSLGCPVPRDMEGRPLLELFEQDHVAHSPPVFVFDALAAKGAGARGQSEGQDVIERLQDLGYM